jgi:hypothetical protein
MKLEIAGQGGLKKPYLHLYLTPSYLHCGVQ